LCAGTDLLRLSLSPSCIGCVVQLHMSAAKTAKASCPFCSNDTLKVTYTRKEQLPIPCIALIASSSPDKGSPDKGCPDEDASDMDTASRSSNNSVNLSYTTPEQERKLRSLSEDAHQACSSKTDRDTLESQIREQRRQCEEEECVAAAAAGSARGTGSPYLRTPTSASAGVGSRRRAGGLAAGGVQSYRIGGAASGSGSPGLLGNDTRVRNGRAVAGGGGDSRFLDSLHGLLTSSDRVTSIQQLEDIMLMEV
jgi:hypothetical protein